MKIKLATRKILIMYYVVYILLILDSADLTQNHDLFF